jgi:hypothetical protein
MLALLTLTIALFVRRQTWRVRWEPSATAALALLLVGMALLTRAATDTVGKVLHHMTGHWHIEDFVGHVIILAALASFTYYVLQRLADDEYLGYAFKQWVEYPLTVIIPLMLFAFVASDASAHYSYDLSTAPDDGWLQLYRALYYGASIYLVGYGMRVLLLLRRQAHGSRSVIDLFLLAAALTQAQRVLRFIATAPRHDLQPLAETAQLLETGAMCVMAVGLTVSWCLKMRPYKGLPQTVRGKVGPPPREPEAPAATA